MRQLSGISCSTHRFILYLGLDTSSWLLATISIERFIAVCKPGKHKAIKSARFGLKVIAVLILVQIAFNIHVFFTRGRHWTETKVIDGGTLKSVEINCGYTSKEARFFWTNHQGWMAMLWYCCFPFTVMLITTILIIKKLRTLQHSMLSRNSSSESATERIKKTNTMTRMLLSVTLYFLIITTPIFIFTMFQSLLFYQSAVGERRLAKLELTDACLTIFLYLNHSINFFLYCLTGRRFRQELKIMFNFNKTFIRKISSRKSSKPAKNEAVENGNVLKPDYNMLPSSSSPMLTMRSDVQHTHSTSLNVTGL